MEIVFDDNNMEHIKVTKEEETKVLLLYWDRLPKGKYSQSFNLWDWTEARKKIYKDTIRYEMHKPDRFEIINPLLSQNDIVFIYSQIYKSDNI